MASERKNGVILTQKVEWLAELKFDPEFRDWRIFESNWLDKLTRYWESVWLKCSLLTRNLGSNYSSACDSTFKVKMTTFFLSVRLFPGIHKQILMIQRIRDYFISFLFLFWYRVCINLRYFFLLTEYRLKDSSEYLVRKRAFLVSG